MVLSSANIVIWQEMSLNSGFGREIYGAHSENKDLFCFSDKLETLAGKGF